MLHVPNDHYNDKNILRSLKCFFVNVIIIELGDCSPRSEA